MNLLDKQITVPLTVIDPTAEQDLELEVKLGWCPGREPSGMSGPPENYDPGWGPEIEIKEVRACGGDAPIEITEEQEEAIAEWIACNEPADWHEPDYPEDWREDEKWANEG